MSPRTSRIARPLLPVLAVLATLVSAPAAPAASSYPVFEVSADEQALGKQDDLWFDTYNFDAAGETASMTITTPAAFGASVVRAVGTRLGEAHVGMRPVDGGSLVVYDGSLVVMSPVAFAADVNAEACAPGAHTAVWSLNVSGQATKLVIPIAVDRSGNGYKLIQCFGAVKALERKMAYSYFEVPGVFRNPVKRGLFLFSGAVTPFAADGTPDLGSVYELRAYEALPQSLEARPVYTTATKTLTVTGSATAVETPRPDTEVHILASTSGRSGTWKDVGYTISEKDGTYSYLRKFTRFAYRYAYARIDSYSRATCAAGSTAPGGCASASVDGAATYSMKIAHGLVIRVKSTSVAQTDHDALPKGASKGDRSTSTSSLTNLGPQFGRTAGAIVGSDASTLTLTSAKTVVAKGVTKLPGGTINVSGALLAAKGGVFSVPIVGGTGAFHGATGILLIGPGNSPVNTYQLALP